MKLFPDFDDPIAFYSFWIFAGTCLIQLIYVILFFARLAYKKNTVNSTQFPPISIVIAARNESDNLYENLPKILKQDYPKFEVIVVNHQSIDDSKHLLGALQRDFPNLIVMDVEKSRHLKPSKKLPLTLGIKKANFEHLLLTDADCAPISDQWIKSMASQFSEKKQIVLGYGPLKIESGWLNKFIRFDATFIAVHYLSMALNRIPYMGVGRNLAYTKTMFNSTHGFKSHYAIISGDDDLFIQEAARKNNYTIQLDPDSFVYSDAKKDWDSFVAQKARHYTTAPHYKVFKRWMLGIYPASLLILIVSFVILIVQTEWQLHALIGLGSIMLLKWWFLGKCFSRLKAKNFIALLPFLDILYAIAMPFFYYSTQKKGRSEWK